MTPHLPIDTPEGLTILAERFRVWSEVAVNPAQRANLLEIAESYDALSREAAGEAGDAELGLP
jgi:hypothetical protein